jgi:RNA polymerase sigma factor (sigma-70 family)
MNTVQYHPIRDGTLALKWRITMPNKQDDDYYIDNRWRDLGLTPQETMLVLTICRKYVSKRDPMEDIIQAALMELHRAFTALKERNEEIRNRTNFIYTVVKQAIKTNFIQTGNKDLIYHCVNMTGEIPMGSTIHACGSQTDTSFYPYDTVDRNILLWDAINESLSDTERSILLASATNGTSQETIAEYHNVSQPRIATRMKNVRITLRKRLGPILYGDQ